MKKPRAKIRKNCRKLRQQVRELEWENENLKRANLLRTSESLHIEEFKAKQRLDIFEAGINGAIQFVKENMERQIGTSLAENRYITFDVAEDPINRGVIITGIVKVVRK